MPLRDTAVGHRLDTITAHCDARWLMAYAAGVPDERAELYATDADLCMHPLFPVAPEWQLLAGNRSLPHGMTPEEAKRGIHIGHDLVLARRVRPGESITVQAHIAAVARRAFGATQETMFVATGDDGDTVWRTRFTSLFLGVELEGDPSTEAIDWPPLSESLPTADPLASRPSFVRTIDAHVYSECARIWNPIHTDVTAARRAGLAAPILHGTATLARAISIVTELADVPLAAVCRVACQFDSMVTPGSALHIRLLAANENVLGFDVLDEGGRCAVSSGTIHHQR